MERKKEEEKQIEEARRKSEAEGRGRRRMSARTNKVKAASKGFTKGIAKAMREEERKAGLLIKAHEREQQAAGSEVPGLSGCLLDGEPTEFRTNPKEWMPIFTTYRHLLPFRRLRPKELVRVVGRKCRMESHRMNRQVLETAR